MLADDLIQRTATELVAAVRTRAVSAQAVVSAFLDRTDRLEPQLNTYVTRTDELALEAAAAVDHAIADGRDPGPLAGLPVSVKDLIAVGGVRQTFGSRLFEHNVAAADAPAVARLRAAGACITGKTTTSELGGKAVGDAPLTGYTRNPWNLAHTTGGSSAGAAAGVAAGLVPVALGTDGGGSIRIPASFCGLVGVKAQFGRVPVWPASATAGLAHVGPLARNIDDAVLVLSVIAGYDARDPASVNAPVPDWHAALHGGAHGNVNGLRIGWCPDFGYGHVAAEVLLVCLEALAQLARAGAQIITLPPPFARDPAGAWNPEFYAGIANRLAAQGDWASVAPRLDPALSAAAEAARGLTDADRADAQRQRAQVCREVAEIFDRVDVLASPTMPLAAPPVAVDVPAGHEGRSAVDWSYFTYPFNVSGNPALSVPAGMGGEGLPIGLQLVAPALGEAMLLRVAAAARVAGFGHPVFKA
jgi:aspartyl-tRNA(Asn)/glutamyl-tRNA(Gln) amidotransferase subunit A